MPSSLAPVPLFLPPTTEVDDIFYMLCTEDPIVLLTPPPQVRPATGSAKTISGRTWRRRWSLQRESELSGEHGPCSLFHNARARRGLLCAASSVAPRWKQCRYKYCMGPLELPHDA